MDSCAAAAREDGDEARWVVVVDDPAIQVIDEWIKTKNIHGSHCSCRDGQGAMREADPEQRTRTTVEIAE